jgi:hypothetical protein
VSRYEPNYEPNPHAGVYDDYSAGPRSAGRLWAERLAALVGIVISLLYLSNLGVGLVELLPDNVPLVGNLDEAFFTVLLLACLRKLGINLLPHLRPR